MNLRFEVSDDNSRPAALTLSEEEEIEFRNCSFENIDGNGVITTSMIGIGDSAKIRTGVNRFTNCLFRNFKTAVNAFCCTTQTQSPYFTNSVFQQCSTDIAFPAGASAFCHLDTNQIHSVSVGTVRYTDATAINNLITLNCTGALPKRNVSLSNISLVDEGYSDFRLAPRSPLIDNGTGNDDIGSDNIDLIYTFSRFLDATIIFTANDTIMVENGVLVKNTLGSEVLLKQKTTLNLRPVYEVIITTNFIDRPSEVRIKLNDPSSVPDLPSAYVVFDVKINGYTFTQMNAAGIPVSGDSTIVQVTPDNISPSPVANVTTAQTGNDVDITWSPNTEPDIARYKVYRAPLTAPDLPELVASVNKYTSSYTDSNQFVTGLAYSVVAYDSTGNQSTTSRRFPC